jgi:hypothetical protein
MIVREGHNRIELLVGERVPDHLPAAGDVRFEVTVSSNGFGGRTSAWIDAKSLGRFSQELRKVETLRQGTAELTSMSPGDFILRVETLDRRGHMAISGQMARHSVEGQATRFRHTLEFGFRFDCTELPRIASEFEDIENGDRR